MPKKKTVSVETARPRATANEKRIENERVRRREAFLAAAHNGDVGASVAAVLPVVRETILDNGVDHDHLIQQVHRLVLESENSRPAGWGEYCDALSAAYALGLAMGQQIAPGFFKTGGAR